MIRIFIAFVVKELLHIVRDIRTLAILFGMPLALVFIFGYTVTNEFKGASMAVYDMDRGELSIQLIEHIQSSGHFQLILVADRTEILESAFRRGLIKMAVVIPPGFGRNFQENDMTSVQLIADATEPNYAATLVQYGTAIVRSFDNGRHSTVTGRSPIEIETRMWYNPNLLGAYYFVPGVVALILMLICAMMTSLTIAKEKETGTMDLLLVSPLPPLVIILGKVTPYAFLSFVTALFVFALGYVVFEVPVIGSLSLLLGLCLLYLLVALILGVLISTKAKTQQVAMMMSLFTLLMPTMLLSGFIFPIASMPLFLQYLSSIIPAKYFILIEKSIMLKGAGWSSVIRPSMILMTMALVLLLATWKNFKTRYQ